MITILSRVEPPKEKLVTTEDLKTFGKIDFDGEDTLLESLISSATTASENATNRAYLPQKWKVIKQIVNGRVILPRPPLLSVEKVVLDGRELSSSEYKVYTGDIAMITIANVSGIAEVEVDYTCGFGEVKDVSEDLKTAVKIRAVTLYENRSEQSSEQVYLNEMGARELEEKWRVSAV